MKKQIIVTMLLAAALGTVSPSMKAEAKWRADANGRWYTIKAAPGYAVGWKQIGKYTYYFEKNKYAVTGWKLIDKKWYYFDIKGRLLANRWVDGYYLSADGSMAASTVITSGDQSYTIDANGNIVRDPSSADGSDILIPGVTENKNTWVENDGKYYYYNYKGKLAKGWLRIRDKTYYLNTETGERYSGWLKYNGKYYYFDAETGALATKSQDEFSTEPIKATVDFSSGNQLYKNDDKSLDQLDTFITADAWYRPKSILKDGKTWTASTEADKRPLLMVWWPDKSTQVNYLNYMQNQGLGAGSFSTNSSQESLDQAAKMVQTKIEERIAREGDRKSVV